jgi:hypothetical protein
MSTKKQQHHRFCEGHIECPECGYSCARRVVLDQTGRQMRVVCLKCKKPYSVIIAEEPEQCPTTPSSTPSP